MSSTSSSSEDETERFKEAVDSFFLTEDLYRNNGSVKKDKDLPKPKQSLRNQNHQIESINPFSIKVTPEFQKHVSQHLARVLDKSINDNEIFLKRKKSKSKRLCSGVKLLRNSKDFLVINGNNEINFNTKRQVDNDSDGSDIEKKAREVAVTPEWVLSKKETECWAPDTRGEVEVIKVKYGSKDMNNIKKKKKKKKKNLKQEI